MREAIRRERKLEISYGDAAGRRTSRTIWPFALGFFERARVVVAWCETRRGFRHFRLDRVTELEVTTARYPRGRAALLAEWRQADSEREGPAHARAIRPPLLPKTDSATG